MRCTVQRPPGSCPAARCSGFSSAISGPATSSSAPARSGLARCRTAASTTRRTTGRPIWLHTSAARHSSCTTWRSSCWPCCGRSGGAPGSSGCSCLSAWCRSSSARRWWVTKATTSCASASCCCCSCRPMSTGRSTPGDGPVEAAAVRGYRCGSPTACTTSRSQPWPARSSWCTSGPGWPRREAICGSTAQLCTTRSSCRSSGPFRCSATCSPTPGRSSASRRTS